MIRRIAERKFPPPLTTLNLDYNAFEGCEIEGRPHVVSCSWQSGGRAMVNLSGKSGRGPISSTRARSFLTGVTTAFYCELFCSQVLIEVGPLSAQLVPSSS